MIKHNSIFDIPQIYPWIPALYKAEKYNDVLPESEEFLSEVSTWMDHNEQKGQLLCNYIFEHDKDGKGIEISSFLDFDETIFRSVFITP